MAPMTRWTCALILGAALIPLPGCGVAVDPWQDVEGKLRIVTTIAPLESFARAVGGDRVAIRCLCTSTGPHHYEPDTGAARLLGKADLFLAVGLTLDDTFAEAMAHMARRPELIYVKVGK